MSSLSFSLPSQLSIFPQGRLQCCLTRQRLGPPDDPQQLLLAQLVEAAEQQVGHHGLAAVILGVHRLRLNVLQDVGDGVGEMHLADARYARHGGQGLTVTGHGQVGLEHHGRGHAQSFQGPEALQFPPCVMEVNCVTQLRHLLTLLIAVNIIVTCVHYIEVVSKYSTIRLSNIFMLVKSSRSAIVCCWLFF